MNPPKRILQLTDLHLFSNQQSKLIGFNPYKSLQQVVAQVADSIAKKSPNLIALTGDISQDYSLESYKIAARIFNSLACPTVAIMGNHDYPVMFTKVFPDPTNEAHKLFSLDNWRILFLNSYWPEHVGGQLAKTELDFLQKTLAESKQKYVIIFLHHPVLSVGSDWLDKLNLSNTSQFLEIIDQYQNIKAVLCGHVHQDTMITRLGVSYISTPSTSWQFAVKTHNFKLDTLMPGYRWIDLYEDGTFQTGIERIDHDETLIPDLSSKGY
jgi:3',5'-cyclic-AMP phosphodiesterase